MTRLWETFLSWDLWFVAKWVLMILGFAVLVAWSWVGVVIALGYLAVYALQAEGRRGRMVRR